MDEELRGKGGARVARRIRVRGRVQGVGFRFFARTQARELGVEGWARNLPDGRSVLVHVEGPASSVEQAVQRIGRGPTFASVEGVEVSEVEPEGASAFEIRS